MEEEIKDIGNLAHIPEIVGIGSHFVLPIHFVFLAYQWRKMYKDRMFLKISKEEAKKDLYRLISKKDEILRAIERDREIIGRTADEDVKRATEIDLKMKKGELDHIKNDIEFINILITVLEHKEFLDKAGINWKKIRRHRKQLAKEMGKIEKAEKDRRITESDILTYLKGEIENMIKGEEG